MQKGLMDNVKEQQAPLEESEALLCDVAESSELVRKILCAAT